MLRKMTSWLLLIMMVVSTPQAWAAAATPLEKLAEVERILYGTSDATNAMLPRINRVEADLYGASYRSADPLLVRIDKLWTAVASGGSGASIIMKLNAAEWMLFFKTQSSNMAIVARLNWLEEQVSGQANAAASFANRVDDLVSLVWPGGVLNTADVNLLPGTKVKVKLLTELSSTTSREGDEVRYEVVSDIKVDNKIAIPAGAQGKGSVKQVKKAGPFGQDAQVTIDLGTLRAMDGTMVSMTSQPAAAGGVGQTELAAGASLGGMVLLGPLGLAAGYLVQGKSQTIPVDAELTIEVKDATTVRGLSLVPLN